MQDNEATTEDIKEFASDKADEASDKFENFAESAIDKAEDIREDLGEKFETAKDYVGDTYSTVLEGARETPVFPIAIACLATGLFLGSYLTKRAPTSLIISKS